MKSVRLSDSRWSFFVSLALLAALLLSFSGKSCAQVDIQVPRANRNYVVVARSASWGMGGGTRDCTVSTCGVNNNFILPVLYPQEMICIVVFNSSTSSATFTLKVAATNDPAVTSFGGNTGRWSSPLAADGTSASGSATIAAGGFGQFYAQLSGASSVVLIFSASSVQNGGADITVSQEVTTSYSANPGTIVNTNLGNPSSAIGGVNLVQLGVINASGVAYLVPTGSNVAVTNAPQGPANSQNPAVPIQSVFMKGANDQATNIPNPFVGGCVNGVSSTVAANRTQYVNCDTNGIIKEQGAIAAGSAASGANPFMIAIQDGSGNVRPASSTNPVPIVFSATGALDPCQDAGVAKTSIFKDITTATTTAVVASSASTVVYVCGYEINMTASAASADTVQLEDGTGAACVTTQIPETPNYSSGLLSAGASHVLVGFGGMTIFQSVAGGELCAVSTVGTTPKISLMVTYVQQ